MRWNEEHVMPLGSWHQYVTSQSFFYYIVSHLKPPIYLIYLWAACVQASTPQSPLTSIGVAWVQRGNIKKNRIPLKRIRYVDRKVAMDTNADLNNWCHTFRRSQAQLRIVSVRMCTVLLLLTVVWGNNRVGNRHTSVNTSLPTTLLDKRKRIRPNANTDKPFHKTKRTNPKPAQMWYAIRCRIAAYKCHITYHIIILWSPSANAKQYFHYILVSENIEGAIFIVLAYALHAYIDVYFGLFSLLASMCTHKINWKALCGNR